MRPSNPAVSFVQFWSAMVLIRSPPGLGWRNIKTFPPMPALLRIFKNTPSSFSICDSSGLRGDRLTFIWRALNLDCRVSPPSFAGIMTVGLAATRAVRSKRIFAAACLLASSVKDCAPPLSSPVFSPMPLSLLEQVPYKMFPCASISGDAYGCLCSDAKSSISRLHLRAGVGYGHPQTPHPFSSPASAPVVSRLLSLPDAAGDPSTHLFPFPMRCITRA